MNKRTIESILTSMKEMIENRQNVSPHWWLDGAQMLNVLIEEIEHKAIELEYYLAQEKARLLETDEKVNRTDAKIRAMPEYMELQKIKARINRVNELIRIAKKQATLTDDAIKRN